jgi:hypothetical protein
MKLRMSCNYQIKTRCGKSMKEILYKYHMKKCAICKGKKPEINMHAVNNMMHNTKGKKIEDLTIKAVKSHGYKKGAMKKLSNNMVNDLQLLQK